MSSAAKIGVMGGTFDPIHFGHLVCAESARESLGLGKVIFIPAGNPSFKAGKKLASAHDRLSMCELACKSNKSFEVSRMEIDRDGVTYTSDTMRELKRQHPCASFHFIVGSDSFLTLHKWHEFRMLADGLSFAVLIRPGNGRQQVEGYMGENGIHADIIDCPKLDISSSALRDMAEHGRSLRYLTPDEVYDYICEHRLYGSSGCQV